MASTTETTTDSQITHLFERQKEFVPVLKRRSANERSRQLKGLADFIKENQKSIEEAAFRDFRKPAMEVRAMEVYPVLNELHHIRKNLKKWSRPETVSGGVKFAGAQSKIIKEPKGQVLVISPWNYPFNLSMIPLITAIAAGNSVILKPSEYSPYSSQLLYEFIDTVFDSREAAVVLGESSTAEALIEHPFNHIIFTGSSGIGRKVMRQASSNLSDITLELGGKSPALIDFDADINKAVSSIIWGKMANAGQTCVAPDYVLVPKNRKQEVVNALSEQIKTAYGDATQIQNGNDYARIVNHRHFQRIMNLLNDALEKGAILAHGGENVESDRFIEPTIITDVPSDAAIREEEIFGPVLPVITYTSLEQAIDYINRRKSPLTIYAYTQNRDKADELAASIISGSVIINDFFGSYVNPNLPFGGINESGIGKLHGEYGFKALSNEKAVFHRKRGRNYGELLMPPYKRGRQKLARFFMKYF